MKRKGLLVGILCVLLVLLIFPAIVNKGSKDGLMLWFSVVLPALLPFLVISGMIMRLGAAGAVGRVIYPVAHRVLGLSEHGCYALVVGWLSGIPMGAKAVADLYREGLLSRQEAQYLLTFINNPSPMFMLEYIGIYCMGLKKPAILLVVVYLSACISALLQKKHFLSYQTGDYMVKYGSQRKKQASLMGALDASISDSFVTVTKIGGYIILFSILAEFIEQLMPYHQTIKLLGLSIMELTTGGEHLKVYDALVWQKWILGAAVTTFGGLSGAAQTFSVLQGTDLSMKSYMESKLLHCAVALAAAFFAVTLKIV